jgi:hypothetical protein
MPFRESVAAAEKAGLYARSHSWDREVFIEKMGALLDLLKADRSLTPRARVGLENGHVVLWHYLAPSDPRVASSDDDVAAFDDSFPCPPFYPPTGPPCP